MQPYLVKSITKIINIIFLKNGGKDLKYALLFLQ